MNKKIGQPMASPKYFTHPHYTNSRPQKATLTRLTNGAKTSMALFRFDYLFPCHEGVLVYAKSLEEARFIQQRHASSNVNRTTNSGLILKPFRVAGDAIELDYRSSIAGTIEEKKLLRSELIVVNSQFETGYQEAGINGQF
jgi:hypothetical protein